MDHKTVEEYILSMPNSRLDYPFGEGTAVYKALVRNTSTLHVDAPQGTDKQASESYTIGTASENVQSGNAAGRKKTRGGGGSADAATEAVQGDWKMYALIEEGRDPLRISLKCDPLLAETLREKYETVMPGYHLNKKHWNTLVLTGQLTWDEVKGQILLSYNLVTNHERGTPPLIAPGAE